MDSTIASLNEFAWKLLLAEREENSEKNVLFSSFSIATVLSMLCVGAKGNTEKQIEAVLHLKNDPSTHEKFRDLFKSLCYSTEDAILHIANLVIVDVNYEILPDFSNCLALNYSVETKQYDFHSEAEKARKEVNELIEIATREKIKDMLPENFVDPDTKLMLINGTYFKGNWSWPFVRDETSKMPFYTINNEEIMVDTMYRKASYNYYYRHDLCADFLEIPYSGNKFSMVIILPNDIDGLPKVEKIISVDEINKAIRYMREEPNLHLYLPKFKLEESFPLKDRLIQLGMVDAFDLNADLSGIDGKRDLITSEAIHKAFVEVNEEGTEAGAATVVLEQFMSANQIFVNHPFMFIIREKTTGLMLFTGSVYKL